MTAAVVTLALLALAMGTLAGTFAVWWRNAERKADAAQDLYRAQLDVNDEQGAHLTSVVTKLAASEMQLTEAKARLVKSEIQRNNAEEKNARAVEDKIRNAPDAAGALDEFNSVLQEGHALPQVPADSGADGDRAAGVRTVADPAAAADDRRGT